MNLKLIFSTCLFFLWSVANAQVKSPERIIGNWVNEKSNSWEYGFFEDFAVYNSDFWEYETVRVKNNRVKIKLRKGDQIENLKLTLSKKKDGTLAIARNQEKAEKYKLNRPGFFPYPKADDKPFKNSGFKSDTVTILGYYRNFDQYLKIAENGNQKGPFKITVPHFILGKEVEYFADFDSLGRFKIKFPVLNTQQVFLDWGRLTQQDVVEPGETIFLFADMADYLPKESEKDQAGWAAFRNRPKQILYMGPEARLHNELANYNESAASFDSQETVKKITSDLEYLAAANLNYQNRLRHLEAYIKSQPTLSSRFKEYQLANEKYQLASQLMQYRFEKMRRKEIAFENGYLDFIEKNMDFNDEKLFTLVREYSAFIRDYVGYQGNLKTVYKDEKTGQMRYKGVTVSDADVLISMKSQENFSKQEEATIAKFDAWQTKLFLQHQTVNDPAKGTEIAKTDQQTVKDFTALVARLKIKEALPELRSQLMNQKMMEVELQQIDSLIENKTLQELLVAQSLYRSIEHDQVPLSAAALSKLNEQITIQPIKDYILGIHNYYVNLGNQKVSYLASLKNTEHLKEAKDADLLFKELIAPYQGKVIYVDFWGTWCGPCKEQMPFVGAVKKEFAGKEVIFMYLANHSPEKSWLNVIKQMNLAGENVVHYRLPDEQQAIIERKLSVNSFPTYLLIGKDGNLVKDEVPRPEMKAELISAINKLLKH